MTSYLESGVDPLKNDILVNDIKNLTNISTGFADIQPIPNSDTYLVQCSDGVGTKIHFAENNPYLYETIGQDLVAMCVNDLICTGATPAYFQDYIGMNTLNRGVVNRIIKSINDACEYSGMKLTGGEMAEMPNTYSTNVPELVGFATGFVTKDKLIDPSNITEGNVVIGLKSSGPHSNGYSLIRKISLMEAFHPFVTHDILKPTTLYTDVGEFHQKHSNVILGMAHITGGGLLSNLKRILPEHLDVNINWMGWTIPPVYDTLRKDGNVSVEDMRTTFNMGIGMCLVVPVTAIKFISMHLPHYNPIVIGQVHEKGDVK